MSEILKAENLHKSYTSGAAFLQVLRGLNLSIQQGEIGVVMGHSGVGKSTLLHILGLLDTPDSGSVYYRDQLVSVLPERERARLRNCELGFIFQFFHLLPDLTALENVLLPGMVQDSDLDWLRGRSARRQHAAALLDRVGLGDRLGHRPSQLSGGERQRVAIARALSNNPRILFCDEPTGNLDSASSESIRTLLWELNAENGVTLLIVTHNPEFAERAHWVARMMDGQLKEFARPLPKV